MSRHKIVIDALTLKEYIDSIDTKQGAIMLVLTDKGTITLFRRRAIIDGVIKFITAVGIFDAVYPIDENEYVKTGKAIRI